MNFKGLFIDDQNQEAWCAEALSSNDRANALTIQFLKADKPLEDQARLILQENPDLVALDFRLSDAQETDNVVIRYKAAPLAQQLRDYAVENPQSDFPIILISQEEIVEKLYAPDKTSHDLFDRVYTKAYLTKNKAQVKSEALALAAGYRVIAEKWDGEIHLADYLTIGDEIFILDNQDLKSWGKLAAPHQIARNILRYIIHSNGLLVDRQNMLSLLGIDPMSPNIDDLIHYLEKNNADFRGVFYIGWQRWWTHRIEEIIVGICGNALGNLTAKDRVNCLNKQTGFKLVPAKSRWTHSHDMFSAMACAICKHPTELKHSVLTYDAVPSFVNKDRICWSCIAEGEHEKKSIEIDEGELYIVEQIINGEITPDREGKE